MGFLINLIKEFFYTFKYSNYIKKKLNNRKIKSDEIIIVESNRLYGSHLAYSYICNALSKKYSCRIALFKSTFFKNKLEKFIHLILWKLNLLHYRIYSAFGVKYFFNYKQIKKNSYPYNKYYINIKNKKDLLNFKIENILIGDLIYDSYLRWYGRPTIDLKNIEFRKFFFKSIDYFFFCKSLFKKYKIRSVILSHTVYLPAILGRIALYNNRSFYCVSLGHCVKLSKDNLYNENFKFYKSNIKYLKKNKNVAIDIGRKDLKNKIKGKVTPGIENLIRSPFGGYIKKNVVKKNNKIKILIASHCFFDSPHVFGNFFFNDFYEWLEYLGKLSEKKDYEWYIKPHPNKLYTSINNKILNNFVAKYKKIKLVDRDVSHKSFIGKVDYVLTIHGNIGEEYALFNIPVINGSINGRFSNFKFNINPKNFKEYNKILLNLKKNPNLNINKNDIYFCHYLNYFYWHQNILVNFTRVAKEIGWKDIHSFKIIKYLTKNFSHKKHVKNLENFYNFIEKNEGKNYYDRLR